MTLALILLEYGIKASIVIMLTWFLANRVVPKLQRKAHEWLDARLERKIKELEEDDDGME